MINNGRFQILLRRRQNQEEGANVIVQCNNLTGAAEYVPGNVDNSTPFSGIDPEGGWYDFTNYIENSEKLSLTWDKINSGNSSTSETSKDGSNYDKGVSSNLMFFDAAYYFIYDWLVTTECQILNAVEVKIIDLIANGTYRIFEIKNDNIDYAPVDEPCQFNIKLREQDSAWHCIHKTFIWDDWQGWFYSGLKEHPCFLTCIEPRPRLVQSARMALMMFFHSNPSVALIDFITGHKIKEDCREILNANRFVDAPLVRTYIENVAGKCGLQMDTIFDVGKEWQNLCIYYPQAGYMHESSEHAVASPALTYNFDNRWMITIAELLDKLKIVFAAEWYVTPNNTIVFKYTKDLITVLPIFDFSTGSVPIYDLRYTFNGEKKPAYGRYQYTDDGSDLASQEMSTLYSDIIDYDGPANNPMLEGEKNKNFEFAPTGFVRDGRSKDYMELLLNDGKLGALILVGILVVVWVILGGGAPFTAGSIIAAAFLIGLWVTNIINKTNNMKEYFVEGDIYTGAVRITSEQTLTPRLILWDGQSKVRAKVVSQGFPSPNFYYNPDGVNYSIRNKVQQDNPGNKVYNYPTYFDGDYKENLFDKYHDVIDNPLKSKESHQDVKFNIDLCEDMLNLFGVFESQYAVIGKVIKVEERDNYSIYARISNIAVDYDGNKINIKGKVLRRA